MLTERQKNLLVAILEEFLLTGTPVGSIEIREKHPLEVSPATIRNEMVELSRKGFLEKEHVSSGRKPTSLAWRWFIGEALEEEDLPTPVSVEVKTRIFKNRFQKMRLVKEAVEALTKYTHYPAIAIVEDTVLYAGIAELLGYSEFKEIDLLQDILNIIEDYHIMSKLFSKHIKTDKVKALVGSELGIEAFEECALVFSDFSLYRGEKGIISVFGPARMNYSKTIPAVRYIAQSLDEAVSGW